MRYSYKCEKGHITEIECKMDDMPQIVKCDECGLIAKRDVVSDVKSTKIQIPEHMKAGSIGDGDNGANLDYLKDRMKNRPSGKRKIYY